MKQDKLINIRKPEKGENFFELWQRVNELIDAINDISITILPKDYGYVLTLPGSIQFNFNAGKILATLKGLNNSSNPTSGNTDNPGDNPPDSPTGPNKPDPVFGTQHVDCRIGQQRQIFNYPLSYICWDVADYALVYDNRAHMNLLATVDISYLGFPNYGTVTYVYGIGFGRTPSRDQNMGGVCGGLGQPTCPPAGCSAAPPRLFVATFYACDWTTGYGPPGG